MIKRFLLTVAMVAVAATAHAAGDNLKPFLLSEVTSGDVAEVQASVEQKLGEAGFDVVGRYSPYQGATILGVTSDALRAAAAQSEFGGYAAVQRVALTSLNGEVQVSYTNPTYMSHAYRMNGDLAEVTAALEQALGNAGAFGPDKGMASKKVRKYHYMFGMPYFDDGIELAKHDSYEAAVAAVEKGLKETEGTTRVWRVDVPGKEETVFGVGMAKGKDGSKYADDPYIMGEIDFKELRSTAHLPYEVLVSGDRVYTLPAEFRIAINFPDLKMMGSNSFMNIMETPDAVEELLTLGAGGKAEKATFW
ncbi:hypothetical protein [Thiohalomonas denitrificans]|nr:hypothetical protein [Thiohalomonas denitrificans]